MSLRIDPLRPEDIPEVVVIDEEAFPTPWSPNAYARELENSFSRFFVLRRDVGQLGDGRILGVAGMWVMLDEAHLLTIAVRRASRGRGYGELLLLHAIENAVTAGADIFTLEVRCTNEVAQRLYRKYGLEIVGRRKNYYPDIPEDALVMTVRGLQTSFYQARLAARRAALERRLGQEPVLSAGRQ